MLSRNQCQFLFFLPVCISVPVNLVNTSTKRFCFLCKFLMVSILQKRSDVKSKHIQDKGDGEKATNVAEDLRSQSGECIKEQAF